MTHEAHPTPPSRGALVVRLCNWVGEVVLSVPAIRRLSAAGYAVHLVGKGWSPSLLEGLGLPVTVRAGKLRPSIHQLRALRSNLAREHPEAPPGSLLFTRSFSSALETRLAGLRPVGYAYDGRSPLLAEAYPRPRDTHAGREYWQVVNEFLREPLPFPAELGLTPSPAQFQRARELLAAHDVSPDSYVLLCPFSGSDDHEDLKIWPGFPVLTAHLHEKGVVTVVCPGPGEGKLARQRAPGALLLNNVDLGTYGALLALAGAVVANDTGPGHLAAAVGAPLVSVYGPTSISAWTPVGSRVSLLHGADWPDTATVAEAVAINLSASVP
ncbi:MAG: glycosyltransferase family 9 protein [Luteimonas sp.]